MGVRLFTVAAKFDWLVPESEGWQVIVAFPAVGSYGGTWSKIFGRECSEVFDASVFDHAEPQASGIDALFDGDATGVVLVFAAGGCIGGFFQPHFDRANDRGLVMRPASFAAGSAADKALVHFNGILAADPLPLGPDHTGSQLVEDLEGGFVAGQAELPLELQS